jgi:hypothetical protein
MNGDIRGGECLWEGMAAETSLKNPSKRKTTIESSGKRPSIQVVDCIVESSECDAKERASGISARISTHQKRDGGEARRGEIRPGRSPDLETQ